MAEALTSRLQDARRRIRRLTVLHGLGLVAFGFLGVVLLACFADWLFHASPGLRLLFGGVVVVATSLLLFRYLVLPLREEVRDLDLALRLERMHPELGEAISSSIEFVKAGDEERFAGSKVLRDRVVEDALKAADRITFDRVLDASPVRKVLGWAGGVALVAAICVGISPRSAGVALRRLANPFSGLEWPKSTQLELVDFRERVAKGDPYSVVVKAEGATPSRVQVRYRYEDGAVSAAEEMRVDADGVYRATLENAVRPFSFRVVGGDDSIDWKSVAVVPAPEESNLKLTLTFPPYTRLPPEVSPEGRGGVRAVVGTNVTLSAQANKPLDRAELAWDKGPATPLTLDADALRFTGGFKVDVERQYRLLMYDREGMSNAERSPKLYKVQPVADAAPDVVLEKPTADQEVTNEADVPLRGLLKDDFGLADAELVYSIVGPGQIGTNEPAPPDVAVKRETLWKATSEENPRRYVVDYVWKLAPMKVKVGSVLSFHLEAKDRCEPKANVGKSREIRLRIVTRADVLAAQEGQQQRLREEIQRVAALEQNALKQVSDLERQAENLGKLKPEDLEALSIAETTQRNVRAKIADPDQGLQKQVQELQANLKNNKINDVQSNRRLELIGSELNRLAEQHLPPISQSLAQARKQATGARDDGKSKPQAGEQRNGQQAESQQGENQNGEAKGNESGSESKSGAQQQKAAGSQSKSGQSGSKSKSGSSSKSASKAGGEEGRKQEGSDGQPKEDASSQDGQKSDQSSGKSGSSKGSQSKSGSKSGKSGQSGSKSGGENKSSSGQQSEGQPQGGEQPQKGEQPQAQDAAQQQQPQQQQSPAQDLRDAKGHQEKVVQSLEQMLNQLDEWGTVSQAIQDARTLQRQQAEAANKVGDLTPKLGGKELDKLEAEDKAAIQKAADRQEAARATLGKLETTLGKLAERHAKDDPVTAETLQEALKNSRNSNLAGKMTEAAGKIRDNKLNEATKGQDDIARGLADMLDSLENRREKELSRLVKQLKEAEKTAKQLSAEQRLLQKKTADANKIQNPKEREDELRRLEKQQRELERRSEDFARQLSKMQADRAGRSSGRAASRMQRAGEQMQKGGEQGETGKQQQQALEELRQAEREIAQERAKKETQLAQEQLAKIADSLRALYERQIGVKEEAIRLAKTKQEAGRLSRGQLQSLAALSRTERGLGEETKGLTSKLTAAKVFAAVLEQAAAQMNTAADVLGQREVGPTAQRPIDAATRRFAQLLDSLKPDSDAAAENQKQQQQQQQNGQNGEQQQRGGGDGVPQIAQIKLLIALQNEVKEMTVALLDTKQKAGRWTSEQEKEFTELSQRQGRLADLARDLSDELREPEGEPKQDEGEKK